MPIIWQIESITDDFCATLNDTQRNDVPATPRVLHLFHLETVYQAKEFRMFGPYLE